MSLVNPRTDLEKNKTTNGYKNCMALVHNENNVKTKMSYSFFFFPTILPRLKSPVIQKPFSPKKGIPLSYHAPRTAFDKPKMQPHYEQIHGLGTQQKLPPPQKKNEIPTIWGQESVPSVIRKNFQPKSANPLIICSERHGHA